MGNVSTFRLHEAPVQLIRHCVEAVGDEVFVACCYGAPFTNAACLRGTDMLARDLRRNPGLAHELLRKFLQLALDFTDAVVEPAGCPSSLTRQRPGAF